MTLQQIYECRTLQPLLEMWEDNTLSDDLHLAVAYQYDRLKAHIDGKKKAEFNENEVPIIQNTNYKDIIER
jgi:hypothetical protein